MSFIGRLLGAEKVVEKTMKGLDSLFTSDEERMKARAVIEAQLQQFEIAIQEQVTRRWQADMASDSWLSKNVRPGVLVAVTLGMLGVWIAGMFGTVSPEIVNMSGIAFGIVGGAYFGGREIGKGIVNLRRQ